MALFARTGRFCCRLVNYRQMAGELCASQCKQAINSTARCAKGREKGRGKGSDSETEMCGAPRQARAATRATGVDEIKELCISSAAHSPTHTHTDRQAESSRLPRAQWKRIKEERNRELSTKRKPQNTEKSAGKRNTEQGERNKKSARISGTQNTHCPQAPWARLAPQLRFGLWLWLCTALSGRNLKRIRASGSRASLR